MRAKCNAIGLENHQPNTKRRLENEVKDGVKHTTGKTSYPSAFLLSLPGTFAYVHPARDNTASTTVCTSTVRFPASSAQMPVQISLGRPVSPDVVVYPLRAYRNYAFKTKSPRYLLGVPALMDRKVPYRSPELFGHLAGNGSKATGAAD